jgi:DNA polymerase-4
MKRTILLADMNSFFASVHQALDSKLRGKPVIVAGDPEKRHGIVLAASYEAKNKGIKTGMGIWEAQQHCPEGLFVKPQYHLYVDFSSRIRRIMNDFTPLVEPFSIDEAFLDVTSSQKLFGTPIALAQRLKERICQEIGITCSIGIGPNKLLAKMAANLQKPNGLTVMDKQDIPSILWPLPVRELFGVGPNYEQHLYKLNIHTIGDLAKYPASILKKKFGLYGETLWLNANGINSSPVDPNNLNRAKSIGQQVTLPRDYRGEEVKLVILELADLVAYRVRTRGYLGKTVILSLKDTNFRLLSRTQTLHEPTDLAADISTAAFNLLQKHWLLHRPVRLVGIALANLSPSRLAQTELFGNKKKIRDIERACDRVRDRYGQMAICRASSLTGGCLEYVRERSQH